MILVQSKLDLDANWCLDPYLSYCILYYCSNNLTLFYDILHQRSPEYNNCDKELDNLNKIDSLNILASRCSTV